ncbi:MAG: iron ABC transporter permease [Elusimicrobia bacterium]|jgi:iron complex transport system permease protein|nr:iron ABC transporter permease [Elusimicrobiota bacterium]
MNNRIKIIISVAVFISLSYLSLSLPFGCDSDILINLRIPKFLGIFISGFSLATAGMVLQLVTKNPLADPFVIGTSAGSMLAIILLEILGIYSYGFVSFFFITISALFFTYLAYRISRFSNSASINMLLSGVAVNSFVLSIIVLFVIFSKEQSLYFFHLSFGSFSYSNYTSIIYSFLTIIVSSVFLLIMMNRISILSFDEEKASTLGVNVERIKFILFIIVSLLVSASVSLSGIIGFIGLMIPHITRYFFRGMSLKSLFLMNSVYGASFLLLADVISKKFFYPLEIPPGVISSIFGAIFFIYLVMGSNGRKRTN